MFSVAGLDIAAVSVGGMETCIEIPSYKLCFDIGRCPPSAARWPRVLFTHAHTDHMGGIVHHCATRDLMGMPPPEYAVPAENHADFLALLDVWRRLDHSDLPCTVRGVAPGDELTLGSGRVARVFRAVHRVPSVGYALVATRRKLKAALVGQPKAAIIAARERGEPIDDVASSVEVAFCGDTTIDVFDREADVRAARVLILEVTFLDERVSVEQARGKGHVHLDEIIARADRITNEALVMTHFSLRYSRSEIGKILDRRLPADLRARVHPLLPEAPWTGVSRDG
jgi:ribonuclease Z